MRRITISLGGHWLDLATVHDVEVALERQPGRAGGTATIPVARAVFRDGRAPLTFHGEEARLLAEWFEAIFGSGRVAA